MSEATPVADPAPAADPVATLVTDPTPAADPVAVDPAADPVADPADPPADPAADPAPAAPEAYADFTLPEGYELDTEVGDEFKNFAKEANLPQDKAQAAVDLAVKLQQKTRDAGDAMFKANDGVISHPQYVEQWIERAKADPEIGGDKLGDTLAAAKLAVTQFGSPALTELLNKTGFGNHPEFIRAFAKAGKTLSEDKVVVGGGTVATPHRSLAQKIYESSKE